MPVIKIDLTKELVLIECDCGHQFTESIDKLETVGIIKCPKCEKEYHLHLKK